LTVLSDSPPRPARTQEHPSPAAEGATAALRTLARDAGYPALAAEIDTLETRARQGRFYVALLGQFKRGKSTLVNALLDADVLPIGVAPVTSVITLVRWGATARATVFTRDALPTSIPLDTIPDYVTESGNPGNARGVSAVEVQWPAALLQSGLCLVDTPGVGSIVEANARETHAFVPHIDAALVVLGVDPPIAASELELLRAVTAERPPLVVVLNKADAVTAADLDAGAAFTRRVLSERLDQEPLLLSLSARLARERRPLPDGRPDGGLPELRATLDGLARSKGAELARGALERGVARVRRTLVQALELERQALLEPAEAWARHQQALVDQIARIHGFLEDFSYRLQGELDRFRAALEQRRDSFVGTIEEQADQLTRAALRSVAGARKSERERRAQDAAWSDLEQRLLAWEADLLPWVDARLHSVAERFTGEAAQLLADVGEAARQLLADLAVADAPAPRFQPSARYYFAPDRDTLVMDVSGAVNWLLALVLPAGVHGARLRRRIAPRIVEWARRNATRVASELWFATADAKRLFEAEVEEAVRRVGELAPHALAKARVGRMEGEAAVARAVARLDVLLERCRTLGAQTVTT
jgi:GTP-binding protein EngB required for normal cell division